MALQLSYLVLPSFFLKNAIPIASCKLCRFSLVHSVCELLEGSKINLDMSHEQESIALVRPFREKLTFSGQGKMSIVEIG